MKDHLLDLWHDLYYKLPIPGGEQFALTCKHAVEQMDAPERPTTWRKRFRLALHLSLCQACRYYRQSSRILGDAVRRVMESSPPPLDVEGLNSELLAKYRRGGTG